jgi:hypothetical protein
VTDTAGGMTVRDDVYRAYWNLACERQRIFFARLAGQPAPWTDDPILGTYRFCNAYRASDRVSQYLIREVVYRHAQELTPEDLIARIVLFRLFSKEPTWELLEGGHGLLGAAHITEHGDDLDVTLTNAMSSGQTLYTSAFILCANNHFAKARKHSNHLALVKLMLDQGLPAAIARCGSLRDLYELLVAYPLIGPFMAYQIATDINYSDLVDFDEQTFTMAGPGAVRGIRKVFVDTAGRTDAQVIHWMADHQAQEMARLGLDFPSLWGRPLQAIDIQNLFCETDKYSRVAFPELASNRTKIKQRFNALTVPPAPFYPPKWGLSGPGLAVAP